MERGWFIAFAAVAVAARLWSVAVSRRNERRLRAAGGVEHGRAVSLGLAAVHVLFYAGSVAEGIRNRPPPDAVSACGMAGWALSMLALVAVVRALGRFWTVKLIVAPDHAVVSHPLMRLTRHPNYVLNMLPELAFFALAARASWTMAALYPLYAGLVAARVVAEERVMRERVKGWPGGA